MDLAWALVTTSSVHGLVHPQGPVVDGLHHQQEGHHLGDAGRLQLVVGVLFIEHGPGLFFHQHGGPRRHLRRPGHGGPGGKDAK